MSDAPAPSRAWPLWGVFCACSWTWVIGMYLPRIMLERHGWAGFLVFLLPNVLGCAALGFVMRTRERSARLVAVHAAAARWFSIVTVAYHAWFAAFLASVLIPEDRAALAVAPPAGPDDPAVAMRLGIGLVCILGGGAWLASLLRDRGWLVLTPIAWLASMGIFVAALLGGPSTLPDVPLLRDGVGLAFLAPVVIAGFLACPYLDLTFHRAHQATPGTWSFGVFGLTFAPMLVGTGILWFRPAPHADALLLVHLGIQAIFTCGAHLRELRSLPGDRAVRTGRCVGPFLLGGAVALAAPHATPLADEGTYLRFLGAYGLVFPAYVIGLVLSGRRPTPRAVAALAAACLVLAPMLELGWIHRHDALLAIPGVVAVLAAGWAWRARPAAG